MFNSFVVAVIVTVVQVVTSVLSAYAFAILDFPGRNVLFVAFLATLLVPRRGDAGGQPADDRLARAGSTRTRG